MVSHMMKDVLQYKATALVPLTPEQQAWEVIVFFLRASVEHFHAIIKRFQVLKCSCDSFCQFCGESPIFFNGVLLSHQATEVDYSKKEYDSIRIYLLNAIVHVVVGVTRWQMVRERYFLRVIRIHVAEADEHDIEADGVHLHMFDLPPPDDAECSSSARTCADCASWSS